MILEVHREYAVQLTELAETFPADFAEMADANIGETEILERLITTYGVDMVVGPDMLDYESFEVY